MSDTLHLGHLGLIIPRDHAESGEVYRIEIDGASLEVRHVPLARIRYVAELRTRVEGRSSPPSDRFEDRQGRGLEVGTESEGGVKSIDERIAEAKDDLFFARMFDVQRGVIGMSRDGWTNASNRAIARARRRLADLEAVRRKEAVEVWATASVSPQRGWAAFGAVYEEPRGEQVLVRAEHEGGRDRLTTGRFIARLPASDLDEVEAEASDA